MRHSAWRPPIRVSAELVDGRAEPIGDAALLGGAQTVLADAQLPPSGIRAEQQDHPAHGLEECRTDVVHRLQPVLRGDARPGEVVLDHHARHDDQQRAQSRHPSRAGQQGHAPALPGRPVAPQPAAAVPLPLSMGMGA
ncbi:hypothetical protein [Streptomyces sp. 135]|uniref:hypothetical protein n=1 Tax=Streptomyces sp. 135 TaxID=2838850 RepID=UPI001CC1415B|nr:hypothetical protein [Streptomyces sp. 135]